MASLLHASAGLSFAIGFVDMNKFKRVNDQCGYALGDAVLAASAQRIASVLRRDDLLARYGGEEFVLLLAGVASDDEINKRLAAIAARLDSPNALAGERIQAGASCGGALYPRDGSTPLQLVEAADARMFEMKKTCG